MGGLLTSLLFACGTLCADMAVANSPRFFLVQERASQANPFVSAPDHDGNPESVTTTDPFSDDRQGSPSDKAEDCGTSSTLARAELRKPAIAEALCKGRFSELDKEWLFIVNYVRGFNEFLEERGSFMDPTGACSRAVEPRASLGLVYEAIEAALSGNFRAVDDSRLRAMLEPFIEDWRRAPFVMWELNVWKREGRLDATSVASRGMCGDRAFRLFWEKAIEYSKRVPAIDS